jgi:tetratricopeptide (TPR) repeat protein
MKKLGRLDDALVHYEKSLAIREMLHSEDPVREDIATVLYHIAIVQYTNERPKDASETLDKLLPLRKRLLKKGTHGSLQNYCAAYILKGNCHIVQPDEAQQAKDAYEEAEKVLKRMTEGQPNVDYAVVISNIGMIYIHFINFTNSFDTSSTYINVRTLKNVMQNNFSGRNFFFI